MHLGRQHVRKAMQGQGGLMRDDASLLGPEPGGDELLVVGGGEMNESVEPALGSRHAAGLDVFSQKLARVTRLGCLFCGEIPGLANGDLEKPVPTRSLRLQLAHARNVTLSLVLCKGKLQSARRKRRRNVRLKSYGILPSVQGRLASSKSSLARSDVT